MAQAKSFKLFANVAGKRRIELPEIAEGFWIEVREELTIGEQRSMFAKAYKGQVDLGNDQVRNDYDVRELSMGRVCAYLVDWADTTQVSADAIRALLPSVYEPIEKAVTEHVEALEKNAPAAVTKPLPQKPSVETTSPSVNA